MRFTIARRLGAGSGLMLALMLAVGGIGVWGVVTGKQATTDLAEISSDLDIGQETRQRALMVRLAVKDFVINPTSETREIVLDRKKEVEAKLVDAEASFGHPERVKLLGEMRKTWGEYSKAFVVIADQAVEAQRAFSERLNPAAGAAAGEIGQAVASSIKNQDAALATSMQQAQTQLMGLRASVLRFMATGDQTHIASFNEQADAADEVLASAASRVKGDSAALLGKIRSSFQAYREAAKNVVELQQSVLTAIQQELDPRGRQLAEIGGKITESLEQSASEVRLAAITAQERSMVMVLSLAGLATVLSVSIAFLTARGIVRPLNAVTARLKDIAEGEGDLTQRVDETRADELGELGRYFNIFAGKIQGLMKEIAGNSKSVAAASTQIAASAEEMAAGLKQQQEQTSQVSAAVEEMSQSVIEVAKKSSEASGAASDSGKQATGGGSVVRDTIEQMQGIANQVSESAAAIGSLGKKSEQIGQIIGVINDIADQTNLLALNAAIEAARAGEHGRGFAVVADEVRKLAERTTQATEEVARSIREIQTETGTAVERISQGRQQVTKGVELANSAGGALERIVASSQSLQSMVQSIAAAAEEQSAASEQIARSIEQINAVTRESNEGASQAAQAAAQLSRQAESLQSMVGRFKI
jgi:methyl-accepting chemotaxis protein